MSTEQLRDRRKRPVFIHSSLDEKPLTPEAFRVYCHLARRVNLENQAWPSYKTIGECCFRGALPSAKTESLRRKAILAVRELVNWNLIAVEKRSHDGVNTTNFYSLTDETEWFDAPKESGVVMTHHQGSDDTSPGVVMTHHQGSDDTSPGVVMTHHQGSDDTSPKVYPYEINPKEVTPIEVLPPLLSTVLTVPSISREVADTQPVSATVEVIPTSSVCDNDRKKSVVTNKPDRLGHSSAASPLKSFQKPSTSFQKLDDGSLTQSEREKIREIAAIAHSSTKPWRISPSEIDSRMMEAVGMSGKRYRLDNGLPDLNYIRNAIRTLEAQMRQGGRVSIEAYTILMNYWTVAQADSTAFKGAIAQHEMRQKTAEVLKNIGGL